jgi:succinate-acetate transporter protein
MEASGTRPGPAPVASGAWIPANPAPLGLAGFGLTTLVLSLVNANVLASSEAPVVLGMAIAYGGLAQLLAGMWEFRTGNTFGAVAFTSYGAFWISAYFLLTQWVKDIPAAHAGSAVGAYFWAWGILTAILFLCSFAGPRAVSVVLLLLTATFVFLGIGASGASINTTHIGGWVGIATAAAALYTSAALILHGAHGRYILPVGAPAPRV